MGKRMEGRKGGKKGGEKGAGEVDVSREPFISRISFEGRGVRRERRSEWCAAHRNWEGRCKRDRLWGKKEGLLLESSSRTLPQLGRNQGRTSIADEGEGTAKGRVETYFKMLEVGRKGVRRRAVVYGRARSGGSSRQRKEMSFAGAFVRS